MTRQEENQKFIDGCSDSKSFAGIDRATLYMLQLITTTLFDISKSLAIIADNTTKGEDKDAN